MHQIDPYDYLVDVLQRVSDHRRRVSDASAMEATLR
ncbi:MAG: transposase domain-containing protein [Rhodocyclaceae bacterium]|nr:transposase domain-containing protein [Rhodocyclaceae bacterium]